jgi:hypothetical protein
VKSAGPLCQALLDAAASPADIEAGAALLVSALDRSSSDGSAAFCGRWQPGGMASPTDSAQRTSALKALAPTLLLEGSWLARIAQPVSGHHASHGQLYRLYCERAGMDLPADNQVLHWRAALLKAGLTLPSLTAPGVFLNPGLPPAATQLICQYLTLRHRPLRFFPELMGYTLAWLFRDRGWWDDLSAADLQWRHHAQTRALQALKAGGSLVPQHRVMAGWHLYIQSFRRMTTSLTPTRTEAPTAEAAMLAVITAKLPEAIGYHGRVTLQGRSLDAWLRHHSNDVRPVLGALRESGRVDLNCPANSRLLRASAFGGPMFGVFDDQERAVIKHWIADPEQRYPLDRASPPLPHVKWLEDARVSGGLPSEHRTASDRHFPPRHLRQLYLALLQTESAGDTPAAAARFIERTLQRTRWLSRLLPGTPAFFAYSQTALNQFMAQQHRREVDRYQPGSAPRVDRAFCRWAVLQLAPAILCDGAWLAGITGVLDRIDEKTRRLLKIHADELGDGEVCRNHPNVYRRLLKSVGLDVPAFESKAFAEMPELLDAAFDIPVYLLAMGLETRRYLPELLGLNLAIELGGLGAGYMRAIDILRQNRIDPTIIQLHLSIDNLASGHAALAGEAIALHLDEIRQTEGEDAMQRCWRRIWLGYRSLGVISLRLSLWILATYAGDWLLRRLGLPARRRLAPEL